MELELWVKAVLLGIVEGVTEFLPISSTGHLIVAERALVLTDSLRGLFEVFIQVGAVFAILALYRVEYFRHATTFHRDQSVQKLWLAIIVAFIPAVIFGVLLEETIERVLFSPGVVGLALIVGGIMFIILERTPIPDRATTTDIETMTWRQALVIGFWQLLALIPGMSRSGMSMIGGMIAGLDRVVATKFSFHLALPTLGGAAFYKLIRTYDRLEGDDFWILLLGTVVSAIVAYIAMRWLLRFVSRNRFTIFGYYRIMAGLIILGLVGAGYLQ